MSKLTWILWGVALVAVIVLAIVLPLTYSVTFWIALLGLLLSFALSAMAFRQGPQAKSQLLGMPLWQMAVGTLVIQLVIGFVLMALAGICPWLVATLVEGLVLCVDAFALSQPEEE